MNIAPVDFNEFAGVDFSKGCRQISRCGGQRSVYGLYYVCSMGGPIDEIFGLGVGAKSPEAINEKDQLDQLCRYCGRLRVEYELGWASFKYAWQKKEFKENQKQWPLKSGKRFLSASWVKALQRSELCGSE
jgi:hypothetical protein